MSGTQELIAGKNKLWLIYSTAHPVIRNNMIAELKDQNIYRHWQVTASKESYDLHMAKAPLRDIFLKYMPETAHLFGVALIQPQS